MIGGEARKKTTQSSPLSVSEVEIIEQAGLAHQGEV